MAVTFAPPITAEQFLGFEPPPGHRAELVAGKILVSPDPKPLHAVIAQNVQSLLSHHLPAFPVYQRTNFRLGPHSMPSPDVYVADPQEFAEALASGRYPRSAPLLAVEVISAANRRRQVREKTRLYLAAGTLMVWNVYPKRTQIVVSEPNHTYYTVERGDQICLPERLGRLWIPVEPIFALWGQGA